MISNTKTTKENCLLKSKKATLPLHILGKNASAAAALGKFQPDEQPHFGEA